MVLRVLYIALHSVTLVTSEGGKEERSLFISQHATQATQGYTFSYPRNTFPGKGTTTCNTLACNCPDVSVGWLLTVTVQDGKSC